MINVMYIYMTVLLLREGRIISNFQAEIHEISEFIVLMMMMAVITGLGAPVSYCNFRPSSLHVPPPPPPPPAPAPASAFSHQSSAAVAWPVLYTFLSRYQTNTKGGSNEAFSHFRSKHFRQRYSHQHFTKHCYSTGYYKSTGLVYINMYKLN